MTIGDTVGLAFRNLSQAKLRTALTTLGVAIGIASLTGMVSLGVGLQDQLVGRLLQSGVFDNITVTSAQAFGGRGFRGFGPRGLAASNTQQGSSQTPPPPLDDAALKQISEVEGVRDAYPELRLPVEMSLGEFTQATSAAGVSMSSKNEGVFQTFSFGEFFPDASDETCMLSLDMAKRIDEKDPGALIGKTLTMSYPASKGTPSGENTPVAPVAPPAGTSLPAFFPGIQIQRVDLSCRVVGIVERESGGFPGGGGISGLMIPMGTARKINAEIVTNAQALVRDPQQTKTYNAITVKVTEAKSTQDVQERLRKMGYSVFSVSDALKGAKNAFIVLDIILGLFGSIALAVSSLGIVNTMVMSILERTREIGIMKAIGAGNGDIRRIFLLEASAIGLTGGLFGIALGWTVGQVINFGANFYIRSQGGTAGDLFSLPLWLMGIAIVFSILVSLAAGSYPAARAARLDPIQALRHN